MLLADDEAMVRSGFRLILESDGNEVVGEAGDGEGAVRMPRALRAGARGLLLKSSGPRLLQEAVRAAADGESIVSPSITTRLLEHFAATASGGTAAQLAEPLTVREADVVAVVAV